MLTTRNLYFAVQKCKKDLPATIYNLNARDMSYLRDFGYIEACLQQFGVLDSSKKLPYKDINYTNFWGKIKQKRETYTELILRLADEYLFLQKESIPAAGAGEEEVTA